MKEKRLKDFFQNKKIKQKAEREQKEAADKQKKVDDEDKLKKSCCRKNI